MNHKELIESLESSSKCISFKSSAGVIEKALERGEGKLSNRGAFTVSTGAHTGRAPKDRYLVDHPSMNAAIEWGAINQPMSPSDFDTLFQGTIQRLASKQIFMMEGSACADAKHAINVKVIADLAWHNLFARCMLRDPMKDLMGDTLTILVDTHASRTNIVLDLARNLVIISGTSYAGEIKKSVFSFLNFILPAKNVFPMHCASTKGKDGDVALLFGLSGTGKTTLSADPGRFLIGDDEHGWSDSGIFNFEGGCYAKTIKLTHKDEPHIFDAIQFGSVLENVPLDPETRVPDFFDSSLTENTRAAYPLALVRDICPDSKGGHPKNIFFLTCDAFGVLPPISRLNENQALYHFLSGYTAKVAGTEEGVTEPTATFSSCFGAPFMPRHSSVYAGLLQGKLRQHGCKVWLVNTGWRGGKPGIGRRFPLKSTRAMLSAALLGHMDSMTYVKEPCFGLEVPISCPGVEKEDLNPMLAWSNQEDYRESALRLSSLFETNFKKFEGKVALEIFNAGPKPL